MARVSNRVDNCFLISKHLKTMPIMIKITALASKIISGKNTQNYNDNSIDRDHNNCNKY